MPVGRWGVTKSPESRRMERGAIIHQAARAGLCINSAATIAPLRTAGYCTRRKADDDGGYRGLCVRPRSHFARRLAERQADGRSWANALLSPVRPVLRLSLRSSLLPSGCLGLKCRHLQMKCADLVVCRREGCLERPDSGVQVGVR